MSQLGKCTGLSVCQLLKDDKSNNDASETDCSKYNLKWLTVGGAWVYNSLPRARANSMKWESNITGCEQIIVGTVWLIHEVWSASVFGMEKIYHAGLELTERHLPPCPLVAGIKEMNHHTCQRVILFCLFVFACVSVYMCMQMSVEARRVRQLPRNCNFRAIVSCPAWAVGSELWSFARAASVLTCWATSPAPAFLSKNMVENCINFDCFGLFYVVGEQTQGLLAVDEHYMTSLQLQIKRMIFYFVWFVEFSWATQADFRLSSFLSQPPERWLSRFTSKCSFPNVFEWTFCIPFPMSSLILSSLSCLATWWPFADKDLRDRDITLHISDHTVSSRMHSNAGTVSPNLRFFYSKTLIRGLLNNA